MSDPRVPSVESLRALISSADRPVFFSGAGMSAESGIPTFRGSGGLWRGARPEDLATPEAFARDAATVTDFYRWRRHRVAEASPHAGHRAVGAYCREHPEAVVVTQNVDGLHQRSGCPRVLELHGTLWRDRCSGCGDERDVATDVLPELGSPLDRCGCGSLLRPSVVWFGEALPEETFREAFRVLGEADVVVVVGTSSVVQPAASLVRAAAEGVPRLEIDPDPGRIDTIPLVGTAGEWLPRLLGAEEG